MRRSDHFESKARSSIEVTGCIDIEVESWDRFVAGAIVEGGKQARTWTWQDEEGYVTALLRLRGTFWAHNGGRFDFLWLMGHLIRRGIKWRVSLSGSSVASLQVGEVCFRDSARLVPMSLAQASQIGKVRKASTELPCVCGKACGGYCSIRRGMDPRLLKKLIAYMVVDCEATYSMLTTLVEMCERYDLDLRPTIGASAWATIARGGVPEADWGGKMRTYVTRDYEDTRKSLYGGRTQVLRPASGQGFAYDINSAYPAMLARMRLPCGERERVHGSAAAKALDNRGGVFRASVRVPRMFLPPLPVRSKLRIGFPTGDFEGWWTGVELQAAVLRGATIRCLDEALVWSDSEMVLAPFFRRVWPLRDAAGPKTALGTWFKLYANSATGKLNSKPMVERISSDPEAKVFCDGNFDCGRVFCGSGKCCAHQCTGACGRLEPVSAMLPIFIAKYKQLSPCSQVHWGSYTLAATRVEVLEFANGGEDGVYCDTDSWKCEEPRSERIGSQLGEWKDEGRYRDFRALAPKTYRYTDDGGKVHGAAKGVPDAVENFEALSAGKPVALTRGVDTFKTAIRKGKFFARKDLTRAIRADGVHFGDRTLGPDGRTYPPTAKQLAADLWEFV